MNTFHQLNSEEKLNLVREIFASGELEFSDPVLGHSFSSQHVKDVSWSEGKLQVTVYEKEIQLILDREMASCFSDKELSHLEEALSLEFPFAFVSLAMGERYGIDTHGLTSHELDLVHYHIRRVLQQTIASMN
jgi:hypothetical protein